MTKAGDILAMVFVWIIWALLLVLLQEVRATHVMPLMETVFMLVIAEPIMAFVILDWRDEERCEQRKRRQHKGQN